MSKGRGRMGRAAPGGASLRKQVEEMQAKLVEAQQDESFVT